MQNTWPHHQQHPWFATPTLKRKCEPEEDEESFGQQRKRLHKLECGFAELSLHRAQDPSVSSISSPTTAVVHPTSIEEPSSPAIKDVKMSSGSWYEPEKDRIVITDLDDSDFEEEEETTAGFKISPVFLNALNRLPLHIPQEKNRPPSQALILFQPRDPPKPVVEPLSPPSDSDPDAMDIEL